METILAIDHIGYIVAAYAAAVVIVGTLIGWVTLDYRAQRRSLAELDRRGVTRRSAAASARSGPTASKAGVDA